MKTTIRLVLLTLTVLLGMVRAQVTGLPIGSPGQVMKWSLENSKELSLRIFQDNRLVVKITVGSGFPKLKNREELDSFFESQMIKGAKWALTNGWQNRDKPFKVIASVRRYYQEFPQLIYLFTLEDQFSLIKSGDGNYKLPDLSVMRLELPPLGVQVLVPDVKWARVETPDVTYDTSVDNTNPQLLWHGRVLMIPLDIAMSPDTIVRLISGTNYSYQVFGSDGPQAEEPVRLILGSYPPGSPSSQAKKASEPDSFKVIEIQGGGVGRVLQLQQASAPQGPWSDIEDGEFTRWSGEPVFKSVVTTADKAFYRVRSVEKIPTYGD